MSDLEAAIERLDGAMERLQAAAQRRLRDARHLESVNADIAERLDIAIAKLKSALEA